MPVVYDLETYPNIFTAYFVDYNSDAQICFEISDRVNHLEQLIYYLARLREHQVEMIGFNNLNFDYPILHEIMTQYPNVNLDLIYQKAQSIIKSKDQFTAIRPFEVLIPQIDLFKIHHFDNKAKLTSLKVIEINMQSPTVVDLPFDPGTYLDDTEKDVLIRYNGHDTSETKRFARHSQAKIEFRRYLSQKYGKDLMNHNDTKIGKDYFINALEAQRPGSCYTRANGRREPVQTHRHNIALRNLIFPYVNFTHPEFNRIKDFLSAQVIEHTKGVFKDLACTINGFPFVFGTGGIHGSITNEAVFANDTHDIVDLDVTSYYPSLAISNRVYPAHLGEIFCDIYEDVRKQRQEYPKKTPENEMLKLALNGVYGDSNNPYSPFFDSAYMLTITINGQLLLCMLAEQLMLIPGLRMLQINTDGLTVHCPKRFSSRLESVMEWWQETTRLQLEKSLYKRMFIRDVNSYIAETDDGKIKRIGAYAHETAAENPSTRERAWHANHSALIVPKAAEAYLLNGRDPYEFIMGWNNGFDFLLRQKVPRGSKLVLVDAHGNETQIQGTTRYFVANNGYDLVKLSPPKAGCREGDFKRKNGISDYEYHTIKSQLPAGMWDERIHTKNKSKYETRRMGFNVGWKVIECNDIRNFDPSNLNINFYVEETHKLAKMVST